MTTNFCFRYWIIGQLVHNKDEANIIRYLMNFLPGKRVVMLYDDRCLRHNKICHNDGCSNPIELTDTCVECRQQTLKPFLMYAKIMHSIV
jgi:hypothetical protein